MSKEYKDEVLEQLQRLQDKVDELLDRSKIRKPVRSYLEVEDIAYICSVSKGAVYNWANSNRIDSIKMNGRLRFPVDKVLDFLAKESAGNRSYKKANELLMELLKQ